MSARRSIAPLLAVIPLGAAIFFVANQSPPEPRPEPVVHRQPVLPKPAPPTPPQKSTPIDRAATSLGITDQRFLETYQAKRDAQAFSHAYNIAVRFGVSELAAVKEPRQALTLLVAGVRGEGDMVHSFRDMTPAEIDRAASMVSFQGDRMVASAEAKLTTLERELKTRADSCKYGACADCLTETRASTNRLLRNGSPRTAATAGSGGRPETPTPSPLRR